VPDYWQIVSEDRTTYFGWGVTKDVTEIKPIPNIPYIYNTPLELFDLGGARIGTWILQVVALRKPDAPSGTLDDVTEGRILSSSEFAVALRSRYRPGQYHPRVWRPNGDLAIIHPREFALSVASMRNLLAEMRDIFRCIEPSEETKNAYGHRLRALLMLASMSVESSLKAILVANNYRPKSVDSETVEKEHRYTTGDYVKLLNHMRLDEWTVRLLAHPYYQDVTPFKGWVPKRSTESLPWYYAYNQSKHDHEKKFSAATLEHAVSSMAAVFVMVFAQFGRSGCETDGLEGFEVIAKPAWDQKDYYAPIALCPNAKRTPLDLPL
jgi:hypothetical protein